MAKDNIALIGMPGAGKSTLGVILAKILRYDFLDVDLLIQNRYGMTLRSLIETEGVQGFIKAEGSVLSSLDPHRTIISTGGSAVYSAEAMKHLAKIAHIVYLRIDYDALAQRLGDLTERGVVLRGGVSMSLDELYEERSPLYESFAHVVVDTEGLTITEAAYLVAETVLPLLQDGEGLELADFPL